MKPIILYSPTTLLGVVVLGLMVNLQAASERSLLPKGVNASDWKGILVAHESAKQHIQSQASGIYTARNDKQQWQMRFDEQGFLAQPDTGDWKWGLELRSYGYGKTSQIPRVKKSSAIASKNRLVYWRDSILSEWYVNRSEGLLQGWTLASRPPANTRENLLELTLKVRGGLRPQLAGESAVAFTDSKGNVILNYSDLKAWDADGKSLKTHFAVSDQDLVIQVDDHAARYPVTIDPIAQQAYLKASNADASDWFGNALAVSGDTVVVGAPREDSNSTSVNNNPSNDAATDSGAAYVFVRSGTVWTQQAYLKPSNTEANDSFGTSVAISGDTIVVGADSEDSIATNVNGNQSSNNAVDSGAAYVFVRVAGSWFQQAYLKATNTQQFDHFGASVAISGDRIVVGAPDEDGQNNSQMDCGAIYLFGRSGTIWTPNGILRANNNESGDRFGVSVAISSSANTIVVGAGGEDSNATGVNGDQSNNTMTSSGAAYVFALNGNNLWFQQGYLKASNTEANDYFGGSVAISADTVVVGAEGEDSNATGVGGDQSNNAMMDSGAAYVFVRSLAGTWSQQAYLKPNNTQDDDGFGESVAISSDNTIVIGASGEDSDAIGVDGNQSNNAMMNSGAAYVFVRIAGVWSQQAYLKASNTGSFDFFGGAVAISNNNIVVGTFSEDSNATMVNGDQSNNALSDSGAAYIFRIPVQGPVQQPPVVVTTPPPILTPKGKKKFKTSLARVILRGTSTNATQVLFKVGKGRFKTTRGSVLFWKTPKLRLNSGSNIIKVRGFGPGGVSNILKFIVTYSPS